MRYISQQTWASLPLTDFRARLFIEFFTEKVNVFTPHFYQSRLLNLFSCSKELLRYLDDYVTNNRNKSYVLLALDEQDDILSRDSIARGIVGPMETTRHAVSRSVHGGDLSKKNTNALRIVNTAILAREAEYERLLTSELIDSVCGTFNSSQMARTAERIDSACGLYVTFLMYKGFSPTYLFHRMEMLTRIGNYAGRSFQDQLLYIVDRMKSHTSNFKVHFGVRAKASSPIPLSGVIQDVSFLPTPPNGLDPSDVALLNREFICNYYCSIDIEAPDYVTASWKAKELLDNCIDAISAMEVNPRILVSSHCFALGTNQGIPSKDKTNIGVLIGFLVSENGTYFSTRKTEIYSKLARLNKTARAQLGRSLRYLRLARESVSIEQKILNLWISLESIFVEGENGALPNIEAFVPTVYGIVSIERRVEYIKRLLVDNQISVTPLISTRYLPGKVTFDPTVSRNVVFEILRDEPAVIQLFYSITTSEHLKYRIKAAASDLVDNEAISSRIKRSETDVARQVRRIYYLRNMIAHTGHFTNIRPQIVSHLIDYISVCYVAILETADRADDLSQYSIADLLQAFRLGLESVRLVLQSSRAVSNIAELEVRPIV